jgi:hypothetical protein
MKRILAIVLFSFTAFSSLKAQDNDRAQRMEKIQALKVAFITQKLSLTPDEAQRFWPIYNRYETDMRQTYTANKFTGDALDNEEKILNVKKRYKADFTKIIGDNKTNLLFNSEKEFRSVLMHQLRKDGHPSL